MCFIASRGLENLVDLVFGLVLATDVDTEMMAVGKSGAAVGTLKIFFANVNALQMTQNNGW